MDHKIEKFMKVVELESFTDAAEEIHVSQPALSMAIKSLESELGAQLIIRGGNYFQITEEGQVVYNYGLRLKLDMENLRRELGVEIKSLRSLKIGMIDSLADSLFATGGMTFGDETALTVDNSKRLIEGVELDRLDIALVAEPLAKLGEKFRVQLLGDEKFVLVSAPQLRNKLKANIRRRSIPALLTYNQSSNTYKRLEKVLRQSKYSVRPTFFSTSPDLIRQMTLSGRGVAFLPQSKVADDIKKRRLTTCRSVVFTRPIVAVSLKGKFINSTMKELVSKTQSGLIPIP